MGVQASEATVLLTCSWERIPSRADIPRPIFDRIVVIVGRYADVGRPATSHNDGGQEDGQTKSRENPVNVNAKLCDATDTPTQYPPP